MSRHEVTIGENTFYIRRFDAFLALEILGDLQQKLLAPVLAVIEARDPAGGDKGTAALLSGLEKLSGQLDGKTLRALADRLLLPDFVSVSIGGAEAVKLDARAKLTAFSSAAEILELCVASVRYNYADFITRWGSLISSGASPLLASQSGGSAQN